MQEKENILDILKKSKESVRREDVVLIKELSNHTIHSASIYQDSDNVLVAVIVYALSKLLERKRYQKYRKWNLFLRHYLRHIDKAIEFLRKNDIVRFRDELSQIGKEINMLSGNFKKHIKDVFQKAKINKASRIYEHGISMEATAKLLGISIWDLAEYAGKTGISDVNLNITLDEKTRIKRALKMFEK